MSAQPSLAGGGRPDVNIPTDLQWPVPTAGRSGSATSHATARRTWQWVRLALVTATAVLVAFILVVVAVLLYSRSALQSGLGDARAAENAMTVSGLETHPHAALTSGRQYLASAHSKFDRADQVLTYLAPVLQHLSWVPRVGDQVAAAPAAARVADRTTEGALALFNGLTPVLSLDRGTPSGSGQSGRLVAALDAGTPMFRSACGSFSEAQGARATIRSSPSSLLGSSLRTFDRLLPRLQGLCQTLGALPMLLGARQPYRYMLAFQNPSQIRATGGFIGSVSLVTLRHGAVQQRFYDTWLRDNLSVPPPQPIGQFDGEPGWLFRDSNWSPDFPTSAALERFFLRLDLHADAPGLVNITPQAVADALRALGPFYSPEYQRTISAGNVTELADYYTHWTQNHGPLHLATAGDSRKQFIPIVATHVLGQLNSLTPADLVRLAESMSDAVAQRDVLINFTDPTLQALVRSAGADGRVNPTTGDYLNVVDSNISYNKINRYVHKDLTYHVYVGSDRWLHSDLTLRFTNVPAPSYVYADSYGPGAGRQGGPADYGGFIRVLVPAGARLSSQDGWTTPTAAGPAYGKVMFSGYLIVRVGQTQVVHLRYVIPPNVFEATHGAAYRLLIQHQPGARLDRVRVSVATDDGNTVSNVQWGPTRDWTQYIPIARRPFAPVPLPREPAAVVAPGHWIEPSTYLGTPKT